MSDRKYWLAFSLIPEIGPRRLHRLRDAFGDLETAWRAPEVGLRRIGVKGQVLDNLLSARAKLDPDAEAERVERAGATFVTVADATYPSQLRQLPDAPAVLYIRGHLSALDDRALAVVGTRKATVYGRDVAYQFSHDLAAREVTIISGLAHGIDAAAHRGALDSGGRTIAVLGTGIDVLYPPDHRDLAAEITQHGALITEFSVGTRPESRNFPRRNRIISGMSLGVLVVEAPEASGALITATIAADQGRTVFAIPGNIFSHASGGTNRLIQEGATLVTSVDDILTEFEGVHTAVETRATTEQIAPADATEAALLSQLGADPLHIDDIARLSGLPITIVSSALTILELKGLARTAGHMQYCLARPKRT